MFLALYVKNITCFEHKMYTLKKKRLLRNRKKRTFFLDFFIKTRERILSSLSGATYILLAEVRNYYYIKPISSKYYHSSKHHVRTWKRSKSQIKAKEPFIARWTSVSSRSYSPSAEKR